MDIGPLLLESIHNAAMASDDNVQMLLDIIAFQLTKDDAKRLLAVSSSPSLS